MPSIRIAQPSDAKGLLEIYAPYVTDTAVTFEYDVPSQEEFERRIRATLEKYPYLVAESGGRLVGYAYAGSFKERAAYDHAVETTVYVRLDCKRSGVGRALYEALEKCLALQNVLNLNACIGYPVQEDEYLTLDSFRFHSRMGYSLVGEFHGCGLKFGKWYDMIWMEKLIGEHKPSQPPFIPFSEIRNKVSL